MLRGKKYNKVASWQPQGRVKKDKESVNNVVRIPVFFPVDIMQIISCTFFFPDTEYERRQRCQDVASFTENLTVFWMCR